MPTTSTTLPQPTALYHLQIELVMRGATIVEQTDDGLRGTIVVKKRPSIFIALLLACLTFWLFFIPAIVYLIAASGTSVEQFDVEVQPNGTIRYGATGKAFSPVERAVYALPRS
jgi:hypothetical protein